MHHCCFKATVAICMPLLAILIANPGCKRSRRTMQPRDTRELEVDVTDAMYSSSQQINGQHKPGRVDQTADF